MTNFLFHLFTKTVKYTCILTKIWRTMLSLSSQIISNLTSFRNPNGTEYAWATADNREPANPLKVALAEIGYIATIPFAITETALSAIAKIFSSCLPLSQTEHEAMSNWMRSSAFSVAWSFCDAVINVFCNDLIVTEKIARACAASGNFFELPMDALELHTQNH